MTAGLLGAGLGQEWLGSYGRSVQDAPLLNALAENLLRPVPEPLTPPSPDEAGQARSRFLDELDAAGIGTGLLLPDRREARVVSRGTLMAGNWSAYRTRLTTVDGQNLFLIRGVRRVETGDDVHDVPGAEAPADIENRSPVQPRLQGAYLPVTDIGRVNEALTALGMTTSRRGKDWVSYENLVIRQWYRKERATDVPGAQLRVAIPDVLAAWKRLRGMGFDGAVQRDGGAFWLQIDPYLIVSVNNAEPPAG
ncbi:hypothetical protein H0H10_15350 [Streptomyces sp. TRM S81-3]|uniref:Uncharacterized protein n=1 Tax=Streptomyces griseicoloratus TaxID=2752516 RepID=A0A926QRC4_9ACTN|nr:hypothetical protein [Streptomyces griseicoloratus]MBD0420505.1 hypothetical protein [Streptomyces griseicoloratus]